MPTFRKAASLAAPLAVVAVLVVGATPAFAQTGGQEGEETTGVYVSDSGFRPEVDGYSFANYTTEGTNLTPAEVLRMFGDQVCIAQDETGCVLAPQAEQWMSETNQNMSGGHCEGMAASSVFFYTGVMDPNLFGGPTTASIPFDGNDAIQREIAYWWATQMVEPTQGASRQSLTPSQVVDTLTAELAGGRAPAESYTVSIFDRALTGGHAVTPIAIEDRGGGIAWILVYDNNWPNQLRAIEVDRNAETWNYNLTDAPEGLWEGDAQTLTLAITPSSARLQPQECPFCSEIQPGPEPQPEPEPQPPEPEPEPEPSTRPSIPIEPQPVLPNPIYIDAPAGVGVILTDERGRPTGIASDGTVYDDAPDIVAAGMRYAPPRGYPPESPPVFWVPADDDITVTIDASKLPTGKTAKVSVTRFGSGAFANISGVKMKAGQRDAVTTAAEGTGIGYRSTKSRKPVFKLGIENQDAGWDFTVTGTTLGSSGGKVAVALDPEDGKIVLDGGKGLKSSDVALDAARITRGSGDESGYDEDETTIKALRRATVNYGKVDAGADDVSVKVSKLKGKNPDLVVETNPPYVDKKKTR